MDGFLKQSTATTVKVGPFLDSADGNTEETALTISQADIRISKNGGAYAQSNNVAGATHDEKGNYGVPLDTTDTNTLGILNVYIHESGALPVWATYMVMPANVWDSMFGSDSLQVDVTQIGGDAQSATDLKDFADAGYDPATNKVQGVVLVDTTTTNTDMVGTDSAALASVCTEARLAELDGGNIPADIDAILLDTGTDGVKLEADQSAITIGTVNALGAQAKLDVNAEVDTAFNTAIPISPTADSINERIAAIDDKLPTGNISDFDESTDGVDVTKLGGAAQSLTDLKDFADAGYDPATNKVQGVVLVDTTTTNTDMVAEAPTAAQNRAEIDSNSTQLSAIVTDTAELQADWTNGGRLDVIIDAIKTKTDGLPDGIIKNTSLANFGFFLVDSTDHVTGKTGETVTAERSIDGAAFAACANAVTEIGNGAYKITLADTDLNGDVIILKFTSSGADARIITIITQS